MVPSRSKAAAACTAPVAANSSWSTAAFAAASSRRSGVNGSVAGSGDRRSLSSSSVVEPHNPQLEVVGVSRGVGVGARPPVSTETALNSVSTADPVPQ